MIVVNQEMVIVRIPLVLGCCPSCPFDFVHALHIPHLFVLDLFLRVLVDDRLEKMLLFVLAKEDPHFLLVVVLVDVLLRWW